MTRGRADRGTARRRTRGRRERRLSATGAALPAAVALALVLAAGGCRAHGSEGGGAGAGGEVAACDPEKAPDPEGAGAAGGGMEGAAGDTVPVEALAGRWAIALSATEGPETGSETRGGLWLAAYGEEAPMAALADSVTSVPLYGAADLDLGAVGALELGGTSSRNPDHPGVLVFLRRDGEGGEGPAGGGARLLMRLGEDANRADRVRFDGGFTVLRVEAWDRSRLEGRWESGVRGPETAGRFCAVREDGGEASGEAAGRP